jgi:3-oxoacyl-[acyl-carrier protein] reductase
VRVRRTHLLVGASRGIGAAVAEHLVAKGDRVFSVSRGQAVSGIWVKADVTDPDGLDAIKSAVGDEALDSFLYLGGVWEEGAFTESYDFFRSPPAETAHVIAVNLTAPILLAQALAPNLARAENPRIVFIGSLSGLPNTATKEVANSASKFGLQGAAEALNIALRPLRIGVTVINPGNVATDEIGDDIANGAIVNQTPIALTDLIAAVDFVLLIGSSAVPATINLAQMRPDAD